MMINVLFCFMVGVIGLKCVLYFEVWVWLRGGEFRGRDGEIFGVAGGCVGYGECEVGVYVLRVNGDIVEWYWDVCDNVMI